MFLSLFLWVYQLNAQEAHSGKYALQFDFGVGQNLAYHQPYTFIRCAQLCWPDRQPVTSTLNFNFSLYNHLNAQDALKFGIGFSTYDFVEISRRFGSLDGNSNHWERKLTFRVFNFSSGLRHTFYEDRSINPFVETALLAELIHRQDAISYLNRVGVANRSQIGVMLKMTRYSSIIIAGFFQSELLRHYNLKSFKTYVPFSYGVQVGISVK